MAAGLIAKLTLNPFEAVTTVTVQIVTLLIGDAEFDNPKTLAAFALGLVLFIITLVLNLIALQTVRKYREKILMSVTASADLNAVTASTGSRMTCRRAATAATRPIAGCRPMAWWPSFSRSASSLSSILAGRYG